MSHSGPRRHVYQPDPDLAPARPGLPRLCRCGLPYENERHDVADHAEAAEQEARRYADR